MERNDHGSDADHLIVMVADQPYGLHCHNLVQIIDSPKATALPRMDGHVRGTINFHGEIVVLYDMRKALGLPSLADEIAAIVRSLADRKQDHINWIGKLKDEVYHDREISVQTDPHKCAFGKWYDRFVTESVVLKGYMSRFDAPHKSIHALAVKAQGLIHAGRKQEAKDLIHNAERSELSSLLKLFDNAETFIRSYTYEYAVVLEHEGRKFAVTVDSVRSFGRLDEIDHEIPKVLRGTCGDFLQAFGRMNDDGKQEQVLILDAVRIVGIADQAAVS